MISLIPATLSAGFLSFFNPANIEKQPQTLYTNTQFLLLNDAFSLKALFNDFEGKYFYKKGKNNAIGDARFDIGTYIDSVGYLGYAYRKEAVIDTTSDTVKLIYKTHNKQHLKTGKRYNLSIAIKGFETHSIVWANQFNLYHQHEWHLNIGVGAAMLYATNGQKGYVKGYAKAKSDHNYDFMAHALYNYNENYLYDYDVSKTTAFGYTTHIACQIAYQNMTLLILGNDVWGKLYWKNIPYSNINMSSGNKTYDDNGYVKYSPSISGVENNRKLIQKLIQKWKIEVKYTTNKNIFYAGDEHIYGVNIPYVGYKTMYGQWLVNYSYESRFGMMGIDIGYKDYYIGVHANGLKNASAIQVNFGLKYRFK